MLVPVQQGMGDITSFITSQVGGAQDPCTAGGALCPQPQSFGASLNPCCWSSATSTNPTVDASGNAVADTPGGVPQVLTQVPSVVWIIGAGILGLVLMRVIK